MSLTSMAYAKTSETKARLEKSLLPGYQKRDGRVHINVPDVRSATLMLILEQKTVPDNIEFTDSLDS